MVTNYLNKKREDGRDWTPDSVRRDLALHMANDRNTIIDRMKWMHRMFSTAGLLLIAEVVCWAIEFS